MLLREQDEGPRKPDMRLSIPDILKVQLVDDWEFIIKDNQVHYLHLLTISH